MEKRVGKNIVICRTGTCKFDHEHSVLPATLSDILLPESLSIIIVVGNPAASCIEGLHPGRPL